MADTPVTPTAPVTNAAAAPAATPAPAAEAAKVAAAPAAADATPKAEVAAAKAAEIRRLKLKMDGQELDLPEEEVIKLAQQAGVSAKRFQEAAALKKQTEQVLEFLQSQPAAALKKIITDPAAYRKLLEDELTEIVRRDSETPEAKKIREQEERLQAYAAKEKEATEAQAKAKAEAEKAASDKAHQEKEAKYVQQYTETFTKALEESGLPVDPKTFARMATLQRINLKKGFDLDASSLAKIVREDFMAEQKHVLGKMDGEKLMEFLGDEVVKKLSKAQIKKLKATNVQKFATPAPDPVQDTKPTTTSWREFQKRKRGLA